jgi:hypothetical protein
MPLWARSVRPGRDFAVTPMTCRTDGATVGGVWEYLAGIGPSDAIRALVEFLEENLADEERVAAYWHEQRVEQGTLAPAWFDPEFDSVIDECRAKRNIVR